MKYALLTLLFAVCADTFAASRLTTPSFVITIDSRCEEGVVACDRVRYTGVSRKTGKSITLNGRDVHTRCADGVTPCRFLGYRFNNGAITYMVWENGMLEVTEGGRVLVQESGQWEP